MSPVESPRIFQKSSEMLEDLSHGTSWPRETKLVDISCIFIFHIKAHQESPILEDFGVYVTAFPDQLRSGLTCGSVASRHPARENARHCECAQAAQWHLVPCQADRPRVDRGGKSWKDCCGDFWCSPLYKFICVCIYI